MVSRVLIYFIIALASSQTLAAANGGVGDLNSASTQTQIKGAYLGVQSLITHYISKLGPFQDPFAFVYDGQLADQVFQRLCQRSVQSSVGSHRWEESPLGLIRKELQVAFKLYDPNLVQLILQDAQKQLTHELAERLDLQSNLLALKFTAEYLRRYKEPESVVDRDGDSPKTEEDRNQTPPKPNQPDHKGQEEDSPEYPDLPTEYKPFTKDTSTPPGSGSKKQFRIAEVNFDTPYFSQRYLSEIIRGAAHPFREVSLPTVFPAIGKFEQTQRTLTIRTFGKAKVALFIPPLYKPLQPSDPRASILRTDSGGFELELRANLAELQTEIQIPLIEDKSISISPPVRELYTRPVGFAPQEWPEKLQATIFRKFPAIEAKTNPLGIAQAVSDYISSEHLYSVGAQPETEPTEALKAGSFQCDMAAYAMVGLLRDFYKIPTRAVGGYRAKRFQNGKDGKSYLIIPGEAHVWVEVFFEETPGVGRWVLYDPTPSRKDRKDEDPSEERDEYSTNSLKNTQKSSTPENKNGPADQQQTPTDHLKQVEEATARRVKELEDHTQAKQKGLVTQPDSDKSDPDSDLMKELSRDELANRLEIGSLNLQESGTPSNRNPLLERAIRIVLQTIIEPNQNSLDIQSRLSQVSTVIKGLRSSEFKGLFQEAMNIHSTQHPDLKNWLDQLLGLAPRQEVNKTYQELFQMRRAIEIYSQLLDRNGKIPVPHSLLTSLIELQGKLYSLAHTDSQDIALVQGLVQSLPAVARLLLKEQFDFTKVGPNLPTREVAKKLKAGEINELRLLSHLIPLSDFVLNSSPRPESLEIKTWQKDSSHPRGRDLLPLQRYSDLSRAIWTQPGRGIEENIKNGTAYVLTRRKRVRVSAGYGKEEAERITIVLYDTSGSMGGEPARFQAGLISAFTACAISDVSPSGRQRHRVILVPFDDKVGIPIPVTNTQEALAILNKSSSLFRNTGGGTDIQKALVQAMALIADAEKRSGEPLAAANIILMTDGQASIDSDELLKARKAIDRQTPLQTMFIAINQTSEELMGFARESKMMGAERGFYREFSSEVIKEILYESDHLDLTKNQDAFYTDKLGKDLPQEFYDDLYKISILAQAWSDQLRVGNQYFTPQEHLRNLEGIKGGELMNLDRPLEKWLIQIRKLVLHPAFSDKRLLDRVIDDLISHFQQICGVSMMELSEHEQEQVRHLVRYAAGLENGL